MHGGDPLSLFKINEYSARIREDFKKGGLFEGLVKRHLLGNPHKLSLLAVPDKEVGPREEQAEKDRLARLKKALSEQEKQTIVQDAYKLKQHQERVQDLTVLPSLSLEDIPRQVEFVDYNVSHPGSKWRSLYHGE